MEALKKIKKTLDETIQYKYFIIDLDDYSTVNLKWLAQSIKDAYSKHAKVE
jgi:transposase